MKIILSLLTMISISFAGNLTRADDIVTDNNTKLQWQDNSDAADVRKEWAEAAAHCAQLTLGGFSDWKLPDIDTLSSIVDRSKKKPTIDRIFQNAKSGFYWSSTPDDKSEHEAVGIHFSMGIKVSDYKYEKYCVRCVREVK